MKKNSYIILIPLASFFLFWVLGAIGFHSLDQGTKYGTFFNHLYRSLQLFALEGPKTEAGLPLSLEIARFGAAMTTTLGVIGAFLLTSQKLLNRLFLKGWKDHVVIYGLNEVSAKFAEDAVDNAGKKVVVVVSDPENVLIESLEKKGVVCLVGHVNLADRRALKIARLSRCSKFFAFSQSDSDNVEALMTVSKYLEEFPLSNSSSRPILDTYIRFENSTLQNSFERHSLADGSSKTICTTFFNLHESVARKTITDYPLEVDLLGNLHDKPHLVIFGNSPQGFSVLRYALKVGHYRSKKKLPVTIVTDEEQRTQYLLSRDFLGLTEIADFQLITISNNTPQSALKALNEITKQSGDSYKTIICAEHDEAFNFSLSNYLLQNRNLFNGRVLCSLPDSRGLSIIIDDKPQDGIVKSLVQSSELTTWEHIVDESNAHLAKEIHYNYVQKLRKDGKNPESKPAMKPWQLLHESLREQNKVQADHMRIKLRMIGVDIDNLPPRNELEKLLSEHLEDLAEIEHIRWNATKYLEGWSYSPNREDDLLQHDCLLPWDGLTEETKDYDRDAILNIPDLLYKSEE